MWLVTHLPRLACVGYCSNCNIIISVYLFKKYDQVPKFTENWSLSGLYYKAWSTNLFKIHTYFYTFSHKQTILIIIILIVACTLARDRYNHCTNPINNLISIYYFAFRWSLCYWFTWHWWSKHYKYLYWKYQS